MTLYMLKWKTSENEVKMEAFSSFVKASKKLTALNKNKEMQVLPLGDDAVIGKYTPKSQDDMIKLFNTLHGVVEELPGDRG